MRPEAKVQRRGDRSAPDFSWPFASSAMYLASLREMTREKRNHIRHHQPQKPTVRESGVAPYPHLPPLVANTLPITWMAFLETRPSQGAGIDLGESPLFAKCINGNATV